MKPLCHICNSESDFLIHKEEYPLYKCPRCRLVFLYPQLDEHYLQEEVYSAKSGYQGNRKEDLVNLPRTDRFDLILEYLSQDLKGKKILDVGASNGEFLYLARDKGLDTFGVELNLKTANVAIRAGLNIFVGFLKDAKFQDNFFDYIHLGDLIEHVPVPRELLVECRRILKPNGSIIIKTPNLDCFWANITFHIYQLFKIPWSVVTPPHHLNHFSLNNLDQLLSQLSFEPSKHWFESPPPLMYELGSLHLLRRYKKSRKFFDLLFAYFSYAIYIVLYFIDWLITPFKIKDNQLTAVYRKIS